MLSDEPLAFPEPSTTPALTRNEVPILLPRPSRAPVLPGTLFCCSGPDQELWEHERSGESHQHPWKGRRECDGLKGWGARCLMGDISPTMKGWKKGRKKKK